MAFLKALVRALRRRVQKRESTERAMAFLKALLRALRRRVQEREST
jgi:hypothetical protein